MIRVPARAGQTAGGFLSRCGLLACLLAVAALLVPASALASGGLGPAVTTNSTTQNIDAQTELISGTIDPHGLTTSYSVEYAPQSSSWCTGGGTGSGATTASTPDSLTTANNSFDPVSFSLTGLTKNTAYCAMLTASNGSAVNGQGTTTNTPVDFTAGVPVVATQTATATGDQQATFEGTVDPASQATTYEVDYTVDPTDSPAAWCSDPTTAPTGYSTPESLPSADDDGIAHSVTIDLNSSNASTPLEPDTQYCATIVATNTSSSNVSGTSVSSTTSTITFTTDAAAALSTSTPPEATSASTETLTGTINPDGESTEYFLEYDAVGSNWCQGLSGGQAPSTSPASAYPTLDAQDQSGHSVTLGLSNLSPGETYCVELVAQNQALGDWASAALDFTAGLPTADTTAQAVVDSATSAQLTGTVDPAGQTTTYEVEYAVQDSLWCESGGTQGVPTNAAAPAGSGTALPETAAGTYSVTAELTGLTPGTAYCAAIAANNGSNGKDSSPLWSADVSPTNASIAPVDFTAGVVPTVGSASATDETASSTSVSATVDPEDQSTTVEIGYDVAGSQFCQDPANQIPSNTVSATTLAASFNSPTESANLIGLQPGQSYCAAVIATNNSGEATGDVTTFIAGQPSVSSVSTPTPVSATSETLTATVDTTGQTAEYYVAYDTADSAWCNPLDGDSSATGASFSTTPATLSASGSVSVMFGNLAPGDQYCAELFAVTQENGSWTNDSVAEPAQTFTAGYPFTVSTTGTGTVGAWTAVVTGTVNPAGLTTTYDVAYDLQGSVWCLSSGQSGDPDYTTAPVTLGAADTQDHAVSVTVGGLSPNTPYCAELVGNNDMGQSDGAQVTFTTAAAPAGSSPTGGGSGSTTTIGAPSQVAIHSTSPSPRQAVASATIDPDGLSTSYHAVYAPANALFCVSDGKSGRSTSTASATLPFTDSASHPVSVTLTKLTPATRYCVEIVAVNTSGTTRSPLAVVATVGAPRLTGLRLTHGRFSRSAGTHVSFRISQAATVTFTVVELPDFPGRRAATVGRFTHVVRTGGSVRFTFSGRVGRRTLRPGEYLLQVVATDRWHQSGTRSSVGFIIVA